MTNLAGPLYEMIFVIADESRSELDDWLAEIKRTALHQDGIEDIHVFESGTDSEGRAIRACQFRARDDNALDELLDGYLADLDADVAQKFGDSVSFESHTMRADDSRETALAESLNCLNCGTRLRGQYCGNCGQRSRSRLISIWVLLREAFGDLLEMDSRLWRTLVPLLKKPGQLTIDYLQGRRARYMPPFRTYLVLSIIFFVVAFFDPRAGLGLLFEPEPEPTAEEIAAIDAEKRQAAKKKLEELEADGIITAAIVEDFELESDGETACSIDAEDWEDMPEWLARRLSIERAEKVCERIKLDKGKTFGGLLLDNIPIALIVLLPLMALVLRILYPLSRRYFVEHLLFFVHFHAFFFLILTLQILFMRAMALLPVPEVIPILAVVAASFYVPVYLYMAMRRVYGQGHLVTTMKYLVMATAYLIGASFTLLGAVLFALFAV